MDVSTIQLGATVSSADPSSTVTQARTCGTQLCAAPVTVTPWVPKTVVAVIPMMILLWGWFRASVAAKNMWWALAASNAVTASLGSVPVTLQAAGGVSVMHGAQCLGSPPVTPTVEPVSASV